MFACIGMASDGVPVKTPSIEDASLLIEMARAEKAPCFHRSWLRVDWDPVPADELRDRIATSHDIVFRGLTRKMQAEIGAR